MHYLANGAKILNYNGNSHHCQFELLQVYGSVFILITSLNNAIYSLSFELTHLIIFEKMTKLFFVYLSIAILVHQFKHFNQIGRSKQNFLGKSRSQELSIIDFSILIYIN